MFFVINKEKIYAYVVSVLTIVILFFLSSFFNSDIKDTEQTSTNISQNTNIEDTISDIVSNDENQLDTVNANKTEQNKTGVIDN